MKDEYTVMEEEREYTTCPYWENRLGYKCGKCDACADEGCEEYHRKKDEGEL